MTVLNQIGRDLHGIHLGEEGLNLAHRQAPRVEGEDLVVKAREPARVLGNELRLERARAIARHLEIQRPVVGEDGFATGAVAVISRRLGFAAPGRIPEMMGQLAAERPLEQRFLEASHRRLDIRGGQRTFAGKMIKDGVRNVRGLWLAGAGHRYSSSYAPHTESRTLSRRNAKRPRVFLGALRCAALSMPPALRAARPVLRASSFVSVPPW